LIYKALFSQTPLTQSKLDIPYCQSFIWQRDIVYRHIQN
jgi:hypothetical protein